MSPTCLQSNQSRHEVFSSLFQRKRPKQTRSKLETEQVSYIVSFCGQLSLPKVVPPFSFPRDSLEDQLKQDSEFSQDSSAQSRAWMFRPFWLRTTS